MNLNVKLLKLIKVDLKQCLKRIKQKKKALLCFMINGAPVAFSGTEY